MAGAKKMARMGPNVEHVYEAEETELAEPIVSRPPGLCTPSPRASSWLRRPASWPAVADLAPLEPAIEEDMSIGAVDDQMGQAPLFSSALQLALQNLAGGAPRKAAPGESPTTRPKEKCETPSTPTTTSTTVGAEAEDDEPSPASAMVSEAPEESPHNSTIKRKRRSKAMQGRRSSAPLPIAKREQEEPCPEMEVAETEQAIQVGPIPPEETPERHFCLPLPSPLEGVKSRKKVILQMEDVSFTYQDKDKATIRNISLMVSQVSRILILGAKNSGKSTSLKVLAGHEKPTEGTIRRAMGLRMSYVSRESFERVQRYNQRTPKQYLKACATENVGGGSPSQQDALIDSQLLNFGIPASTACRSEIGDISEELKARLVIAAATLQAPHILILDEPSSFMAGDTLGALLEGLKEFKGGVLIAAHNKEKLVYDSFSTERWTMRGGHCRLDSEAATEVEVPRFVTPAKEDAKPNSQAMTQKEAKEAIRAMEQKLKDGIKNGTLDDSEMKEMLAKLTDSLKS